MFTASRIAAAVAILALAGTLAFVASPVADGPSNPVAAPADQLDPADFAGFTGTVECPVTVGYPYGDTIWTDWGSKVVGQHDPGCTIEASDPRISGVEWAVNNWHKYAGKPRLGVVSTSDIVANEHGTWVSTDSWGYQHPDTDTLMHVATFHGTGDYAGLTALMVKSQDTFGPVFDVEGVIIPGNLPETPELATPEAAIAD